MSELDRHTPLGDVGRPNAAYGPVHLSQAMAPSRNSCPSWASGTACPTSGTPGPGASWLMPRPGAPTSMSPGLSWRAEGMLQARLTVITSGAPSAAEAGGRAIAATSTA